MCTLNPNYLESNLKIEKKCEDKIGLRKFLKKCKVDGFYVIKVGLFVNDSKIGVWDKFDGSKIKVMV